MGEGEICYRDTDCETGFLCMEGLNGRMECQPPAPGAGKFGEECRSSNECNIHMGLCCRLQLRQKMQPKKLCAYYTDPEVCIGPVASAQNKRVMQHTAGASSAMRPTSRFTTAPLLLATTPMSSVIMDTDMARERLMPDTRATPLDPSATRMWTGSATRCPGRTPARSPGRCARLLWTPPTSRSARTSSPSSATRPTSRSTTAPPLSVMTATSSLMVMDMANET